MNQAHRNHEILRLMATIGIKNAERSHDQRYGLDTKPEIYETFAIQQRLNRLINQVKESHAQKL